MSSQSSFYCPALLVARHPLALVGGKTPLSLRWVRSAFSIGQQLGLKSKNVRFCGLGSNLLPHAFHRYIALHEFHPEAFAAPFSSAVSRALPAVRSAARGLGLLAFLACARKIWRWLVFGLLRGAMSSSRENAAHG